MSTTTALDRVHEALRTVGCKITNGGTAATCPAHEDHAPSLSIGRRRDGDGVLLNCHAGCDVDDVLAALHLARADLFDEPRADTTVGRLPATSTTSSRSRIVATYPYTDEHGVLLYEKVRYAPKTFRQRRPDGDGWSWKLGDTRRVLYHLPDVMAAIADGRTVYVAEGEKDADALVDAGVTATTWPEGAWKPEQKPKWREDYTRTLAGARVVVVRDRDDAGRHTAATIAGLLAQVAEEVVVVEPAEGKDAADHLAAGRTVDELVPVDTSGRAPVVDPLPLSQVHAVFRRWLGEDYDLDALNAVLATAAVERLDGDPLWLLVISGSGNAKTETVQALAGAGALLVSTISSEGALLSATSKRERTSDATGGLLREIGDRGVLVVKDVTSILSMNRDQRAQVLGALREIYDGAWTRSVGTDGARRLSWSGRVALVGAVTTAWDSAHAVIASMGDRFVLLRMDSTTGRQAAGRRAIGNTGSETQMRAELAEAVAGLLAGVDPTRAVDVTDDEADALLAAADLVTLARTGVEYDYRGDVINAHAPEMPTRFAKQLAQVVRGSVAIGLDRHEAMRLAIRCARDSMPPLRLAIVDDLAAHPDSTTADVRKRLGVPRATVDRQLQALTMLRVLVVDEEEVGYGDTTRTRWFYRLADDVDPTALAPRCVPEMSPHPPNPQERGAPDEHDEPQVADGVLLGADISGTQRTAPSTTTTCAVCPAPLHPDRAAYGKTRCVEHEHGRSA